MASDTPAASGTIDKLSAQGYDTSDLSPVSVRPPLPEYISEIWRRRHFIWADSRHRSTTQYTRNKLGNVWMVVRPVLDAGIYFLIFGLILNASGNIENFAAYVAVGVLTFQSTSRAITSGIGLIQSQKAMIRAFRFPRASLPIAATVQDLISSIPTMLVLMVMVMVIPPFVTPSAHWLLVPFAFLLQHLFNLGIRLFLAPFGFRFPDLSHVMGVVNRFLMYGSGVIFPVENYFTHPALQAIIPFNPVYQMLSIMRSLINLGEMPSFLSVSVLLGWTVVLCVVGFYLFWRWEVTYGVEQQ